jgi:hypothetical protein
VTCAVPAFNACDTTRGIEIARAIREIGHQRGSEAEITFIYPRTTQTFEAQIRQAGFSVRPLEYDLTDEEVADHAQIIPYEFFPTRQYHKFPRLCKLETSRRTWWCSISFRRLALPPNCCLYQLFSCRFPYTVPGHAISSRIFLTS